MSDILLTRFWFIFVIAAVITPLCVPSARAEKTIISLDDFKVAGSITMGGAAFHLPNTNFGAGSYALRNDGQYSHRSSVTYAEFFGKPSLSAYWNTPWRFGIFGSVSAVGSATLGDGDAEILSQTSGGPTAVTLEDANGGLSIPLAINGGHQTLIVEGGRQRFQIDDGFLIGKGTYSTGDLGSWWYAPRYAFSGPGTIRFEGENLRFDAFLLQSASNADVSRGFSRPQTDFVGFDITLFQNRENGHGGSIYEDRESYLTLSYFNVIKSDMSNQYDYSSRADRNGMNVAAISFGGSILHTIDTNISKDFTLYGNFVSQQNSHPGNGYKAVNAYGLYIEPGYTFSKLPWEPHIFYRYMRLSGDKSEKSSVKNGYDTFFLYNGRRFTYGGYWPGEIVGLYLAPLSNLVVNQIDVSLTYPLHLTGVEDALRFGVHLYDLAMIHPTGMGLPPKTSRKISDEVDFSAEYKLNSAISGAITGGVAFAAPAGKALALSSIPSGQKAPHIGNTSGVIEMFFFNSF